MVMRREFLVGLLNGMVAALLLTSCAGFTFKYYGISGVDYNQGKLLGAKERDDLPFSACAPVGNDAYPCVILFAKDFFAYKTEYEDMRNRLKDCQKQPLAIE